MYIGTVSFLDSVYRQKGRKVVQHCIATKSGTNLSTELFLEA